MKDKKQLKIYYDSEDIDSELDEAIEQTVKPFGWERWASGYNVIENIRDIAFEKSA